MPQITKKRLDVLLAERHLAPSREKARRLIMAGEVTVDGQLATKPGSRFSIEADIVLKAKPQFVSRGGEKLKGALDAFPIDLTGAICADFGASTGGFTDCMLQNGASRVYAIDVGYGQLAWSLRQDERVISMERTNARHLDSLPEPIHFAATDVSFISVKHILPAMSKVLTQTGQAVILVKPQFEAGKEQVGKGGVVKDPDVHRSVIWNVTGYAEQNGLFPAGLVSSPLKGPAGNVEFLLWTIRQQEQPFSIAEAVDQAIRATALTDHGS